MRSRWFRLVLLGVLPMGGSVMSAGCSSTGRGDGELVARMARVGAERHGLRVEITPAIDRVTFFGPSEGENLLHVTDLERPLPSDGGYTFWGGCYTWVSPQKEPSGQAGAGLGWVAADGTKKDWPPDPAMDVGPLRRTGAGPGWIELLGPEQRSGLQEFKRFEVLAPDLAEFAYTLRNRGRANVAAGAWINTALGGEDVIALRMPAGTEVYGWSPTAVTLFKSILSESDARGWRTLDLSRAKWSNGIKVYIAPPAGEGLAAVEIAVWRRAARRWMHRTLGPMSAADVSRLRGAGEGPVAVYIQPGDEPIIEAELYGPISDLAPGSETRVVERWRVIGAEQARTAMLP